jgi:3-deoxy-manno-octulosonate cytidylyltransferase (CMP-KDO synthetase)
LRAIEDGMRLDIRIVDDQPFGVDNPHHLERARTIMAGRTQS